MAVCLRPACVSLCFFPPGVCHAYLQGPVVEAEARGAGRPELNGRGAAPVTLATARWAGPVTSRPRRRGEAGGPREGGRVLQGRGRFAFRHV